MKRRAPGRHNRGDSYLRIWETVKRIPRGKVATYGVVAQASGMPGQARLAGYALHNLPPGTDVPWHRVINARGTISLPRSTGAYKRQRDKLEAEGIVLLNGRVDLSRFGWTGMRRTLRRKTPRTHRLTDPRQPL